MSENNVRNFLLFDHEYVRIRTLMSTLLKADFERIIFKLEATSLTCHPEPLTKFFRDFQSGF